MPTREGSFRTGWLILFSADETKQIAQPIEDYGSPLAAAAALIPEPVVTKAISLATAGLTLVAKKAVREDRCLGLYIHGNPFRFAYLRRLKASDLPRYLYARYIRLGAVVTPFLFDAEDPQSLASWRRAFGV